MKVSELMRKLSACDPDDEVVVSSHGEIVSVSEVVRCAALHKPDGYPTWWIESKGFWERDDYERYCRETDEDPGARTNVVRLGGGG